VQVKNEVQLPKLTQLPTTTLQHRLEWIVFNPCMY